MSGYLLVVDDDPDIRELLQLILQGYGYDVAIAADGIRALEMLALRGPPGLILLDLRMPEMSGEELLPLIRARNGPHVPVVVLSGDASAQHTARTLGADGFLAKPVGVEDLLTTVAGFIMEDEQRAP